VLSVDLDELERTLVDLLGDPESGTGAELVVFDPDGTQVFGAPLARHFCLDPDEDVLWIRPVLGGYELTKDIRQAGDPLYAFSLDASRRRGLSLQDVALVDGGVRVVQPGTEQVCWIRPAGPEALGELERWDTFVGVHLSAEDELALDRVDNDSWHGRWA